MFETRTATSVQMAQIAAEGDAKDFNRQIAEWVVAELDAEHLITVRPVMIHEHIGGEKADPHLRTNVSFKLKNGKEGFAFVDMKIETFERPSLTPLNAAEAKDEKERAQKIVKIGETVEMDLLFDGKLCGNDIKLPKVCKVEFLKKNFSPFRIIEGLINESLLPWDDGQNRYIVPAVSDDDDDDGQDSLAVARFEYVAE